ncbi:MAG TPA: DUF5655 domain-containing protein, partial [Pyrinomonadaceae bacterium]|nr:DUF5655 domain-containing protein [Pyrinomonadaceae bacterium]
KAIGVYTFEQHITGKSESIKDIVLELRDFIMNLDSAMEEVPKKLYVAYRTSQNIVCMEIKIQKVVLYLKLNPKEIANPPNIARDVSNIGHFGTGNFEITVKGVNSLEVAKKFITLAYEKVGG